MSSSSFINATTTNNGNNSQKRDEKMSSSFALQQQQQPQTIQNQAQIVTRRTRSTKRTENHLDIKHSPSMSVPKNKSISVGTSYQVLLLPECDDLLKDNTEEERDKDECLWAPPKSNELCNERIDEYCQEAAKHYGICLEMALYILYHSGHDLDKAKATLPSSAIFKANFSADDAFAFKNAHLYFGKNFAKIRQVLPHKTISALVEHYYLTKKQQSYKSFTDNDAVQSSTDSDSDERTQIKPELHQLLCEVCRHEVRMLYTVNGLELCRTCKLYFKATNKHRICSQPTGELRRIPVCAPEMKHIAEHFNQMARTVHKFEDPDGTGDVQVARRGQTFCEQQIQEALKLQKKLLSDAKRAESMLQKKMMENRKYQSSVEEARKFLENTSVGQHTNQRVRSIHSWSNREKEAAVHALIRFNCDCNIVSDIISTKTPDMVKSFYTRHERMIQKIILERQETMKVSSVNGHNTSMTTEEVIELD